MSHPYVPLSTPVTITVDGFWDGDHNGNQPVIVVPNGQGENKKFHLPHGARVHTRPNVAEAVAFTVDKTPKPAPSPLYMDLDLHTEKWYHVNGEACPENCKYHEVVRPADVTDTGGPLEVDDTPPQSDDRVRLTIEGTYQDAGGGEFNITRDDGRTNWFTDSSGAEIRVIARAKPPVPEDPQCDVERVVAAGGLERWEYDQYTDSYGNGADHWRWEKLWAVAQGNGDKLYPLVTTRGPEIVG